MASTYLSRTPSSETNRKTFTWSGWVKRSSLGQNYLFSQGGATNNNFAILFDGADQFYFWDYHGSWDFEFKTNAKYRDTNGWLHIVIAIDTTQATQSDRVKAYINGEQITSWATANYPNQNDDTRVNNTTEVRLGRYVASETSYFNGLISHVHLCEGTQYQASDFGETDSTTGEWKIKTSPSVTYGTNGFFILKDGNSVTDASTNSNNFTVGGGTLTKSEDNPSNVFCTLNPLIKFSSTPTLSNGNLSISENGGTWQSAASTLGVSKGKWYYEYKATTAGGSGLLHKVGFMSEQLSYSVGHLAETGVDGGYAWYTNDNGEVRTDNAVISGWASSNITNITSISAGDIMMVAVDMDNKYAYFGVNGVWAKSGDPTSGSSGTGGLNISSDYPTGKILIPAVAVYNGSAGSINFGNGYFGTAAVSSAGTNASGNGIFEYDCPNGYTALSTKGLNL